MTDIVVFETPFISLIDRDGYIFLHESRAAGQIVALLPYRDSGSEREYLARLEVCPAHSPQLERCCITGGVNPNSTPPAAAVQEMYEEAGYRITQDALIPLGTVRPIKSADTTVHLYAIDVTGMIAVTAPGDGSKFEVGSSTEWVEYAAAVEQKDPLLIAALARLALKKQ